MEPKYTAVTEYTLEKYRRFAKTVAARYQKMYLRLAAIEALAVLMVVYFFKRNWNLASVFIFFVIVFPFVLLYEQNSRIKKVWESNRMARHSVYTMDFYDDHLVGSTSRANTSINYRDIYDVLETDDRFYVMISLNQGFIVDRAACSEELCSLLRSLKKTS